MNIKFPEWLSRLLFSKPPREQTVTDPVFGVLHYSRTSNVWIGAISHLFPGEPNVKLYLPTSENDQFEWAHNKFLQLKSHWADLYPEIVDSLYDYYTRAAFDPTSRYDLPSKDRFQQIIYMSYLHIFHNDQEQSLDQKSPDYEVEFWSPICGLYDGCMRIQITNWKLEDVYLCR